MHIATDKGRMMILLHVLPEFCKMVNIIIAILLKYKIITKYKRIILNIGLLMKLVKLESYLECKKIETETNCVENRHYIFSLYFVRLEFLFTKKRWFLVKMVSWVTDSKSFQKCLFFKICVPLNLKERCFLGGTSIFF